METKDVILKLRNEKGLSQEALAEKVYVTRQAVSRWEKGETVPNVDTLKLLSNVFDVAINTLLGALRQLICQCCGMPLDDSTISRNHAKSFGTNPKLFICGFKYLLRCFYCRYPVALP